MEHDSCQQPEPSDQRELDEDDSAFAKTPIRADSASQEDDDLTSDDSVSSKGSPHCNDHGDRTYFHVWGDMLTCNQMGLLDNNFLGDEAANQTEADDDAGVESNLNAQKSLSIDTSMPCPLLQFGPIPKSRKPKPSLSSSSKLAAPTVTDMAVGAAAAASDYHHHHPDDGNERCCDFSVVAAKNKERIRREEKLRRLERRKLLRY